MLAVFIFLLLFFLFGCEVLTKAKVTVRVPLPILQFRSAAGAQVVKPPPPDSSRRDSALIYQEVLQAPRILTLPKGMTGVTMENVFGDLIRNVKRTLVIEDPFIQRSYDILDLKELLEPLSARQEKIKVVIRTTTRNPALDSSPNWEADCQRRLSDLRNGYKGRVDLQIHVLQSFHERLLMIDPDDPEGVVVFLGRGLAFRKTPDVSKVKPSVYSSWPPEIRAEVRETQDARFVAMSADLWREGQVSVPQGADKNKV
jgi:hypothetical protein